ncbi:diacylglycerol/lipid kinase family protein [Deinococcus malanensis]|uniref:diacylglycerol/lipid kinase family protein n=1 Tax=Deinococcus malanensis TaxID=1706855 RepID=UPI00364160AB
MSDPPSRFERVAVVLNSFAGGGLAQREWPRLERELLARGLQFDLIQESSGDEALNRVQNLPVTMPVVAVGGDGTVRSLIPALVGTGRPLVIVPWALATILQACWGSVPGIWRQQWPTWMPHRVRWTPWT